MKEKVKDIQPQFESFAKGNVKKNIIGNKCVIYTRVSTKEQADNNMSLATQKKLCEQFCAKNNYEIVSYFGGTYESAKNDERKEFNNMLNFIKKSKQEISFIIVYSIDRFSRSGANAIYIKEQLKMQGVAVQSVTQPIDANTASGSLQQNIQIIFSEYDNQLRRDKCITGIKEAMLRGEWCQHAPLGYDHIKKNGKKMIVPNEKAKWIKQIFEWKAYERISNEEIISRLNKQGFKMYSQYLHKILKNPFYCGFLSHNLLEGSLVPGNHEPIVSKELFMQAHEIKSGNSGGYKISSANDNIPLKRFMKCEKCGCYMRGYLAHKNMKYYYKCNSKGCSNNMRADEVHKSFMKKFNKYNLSPNNALDTIITKYVTHVYHQVTATEHETVNTYEKQIQEIEKKITRLEERYMNEELNREMFEKFMAKLNTERKEIEGQMPKGQNQVSNLQNCISKAITLSSKLNTAWHSADFTYKQKLQYLVFPEGMYYDKKTNECRTPRVNTVFEAMAEIAGISEGAKMENPDDESRFSPSVVIMQTISNPETQKQIEKMYWALMDEGVRKLLKPKRHK